MAETQQNGVVECAAPIETGELVGAADHYQQFVLLCRRRIEDLKITCDSVDEICGFPKAYTSKLLNDCKTMSVHSLFVLARGLALVPTFVHDAAQLAQLERREQWIKRKRNNWHQNRTARRRMKITRADSQSAADAI